MDLRKIPNDVQCLLHASARVRNFKEAIEELVYNSLDADSSSVAIRIHIQNNWMQVVDNGYGIKKEDFKLLGEKYATSKLTDISTLDAAPTKYGYQGQALANIIDISQTVKITSRYADSTETWIKIFYKGKEYDCREVALRPSKGTTVEIIHFLFNLDIQRKSINPFYELQDIKTFLKQLSLVFNNVSISLRDDCDNEILFKTHKNRDIYQTLKALFEIDAKDIQELQVQKNNYKVKGFIGTKETELKKNQLVFLNNKVVNNSNLHKLINDNFSKTKTVENKVKKIYSEGYKDKHKSVPFYFLFLTIPYFEYNIIYSDKKTTIEFKHWQKITKLIEKLIKFYYGDIKMIHMTKTEDRIPKRNTEDTRNEVRKIMDRVLGNNNLRPKVFQMQNEVKGKYIKRKQNKRKQAITSKKLSISKNISSYRQTTVKDVDNTLIESPDNKITMLSHVSNNQSKRVKPAKRKYIKCKCFRNTRNLLDAFQNNTHFDNSVKKRRDEVLNDVSNIVHIKNDNFNETSDNKDNTFKNVINKIRYKSSRLRSEIEHFTNYESNNNLKTKSYTNNKDNTVSNKTEYNPQDTVIKSQQGFNHRNSRIYATQANNKGVQNSNSFERNYLSTENHSLQQTYESHKYNFKQFKKCRPQKNLFNDEKSKDVIPKIDGKNYDKVRKEEFNKNKHVYKIRKLKRSKLTHGSYVSIDVSNSDIIEFSKKIRKQITKDMCTFKDIKKNYQLQSKCTKKFKRRNFNIESTYTIRLDSFNCSPFEERGRKFIIFPSSRKKLVSDNGRSYALHCYSRQENNITSIHKSEKYTCNSYTYETNDDETQFRTLVNNDISTKKKLNVIFLSTPQQTSQTVKNIDPINICEAVIHTPDEIEAQANYKNNDIISLCDSVNSFDVKSLKNNSFDQKYCKPIEYSSDKNLNIFVKHNKSLSTFDLKNRHRFLPKGISPIFNNCIRKDICTYNFNMEYFDDAIYNDFDEMIAVNSDIFEPRIQNVTEFTTRDIQSVTNKIKKNNADLIFGAESLKTAKVLGQVDCKFVAAKICAKSQTHKLSEFLALFDQHAVHERIRLENNLMYYVKNNGWKKISINAISMKLSEDVLLYLHNYKDKFTQFGLEWTFLSSDKIMVTSIPEAIVGKNPRSVDIITKSVKTLIVEQVNAIKYLKGNVSLYPKCVMDLIFSEACRYAIKFGDVLSQRECNDLIVALANCKTPFQCAHGRPVMAVLMELNNDTNKNKYKANIQNIMRLKGK